MKYQSLSDIIGLTEKEAELSRRAYGSNRITGKKKNSFLKQFAASFGDPIIKILLIALIVNIFFMLRDFNWYETAGIAIAVLLATLVSTLSEYGSETAFEKLQQEAANINCRVKRSGLIAELPIGEIVAGDIVLLQAGERIPADGKIIIGEISVDQSALNGETKEAHKYPVSGRKSADISDFMLADRLFRGCVVCSGEAVMEISHVGDETFYGRLALEIQEDTIESPLKVRLGNLAKTISIFGYMAALVVVVSNLFNNIVIDNYFEPSLIIEYLSNGSRLLRDFMKAVTLGITVIVMAVPEGLPMMITVVLSANMRRMLKDNVLVRKLVGIETSGSLNILFTDKTGTLTKGKLSAVSFINGEGRLFDINELKKHKALYEFVKLNCLYNNGAEISEKDGKKIAIGGNSTDRAILEFVIDDVLPVREYQKVFSRPFNSKDKLSITGIKGKKTFYLIKGAPEILLPKCARSFDENGREKPFSNSPALKGRLNEQARDAVRLLALCICEGEGDAKQLRNMILIGFIGITDELRSEASSAINEVTNAGVQVVMVTGDNRETAMSVAARVGLISPSDNDKVLTSAELNAMSDIEVKMKLPEIRVIARALPSDKSRLVRIAQETGLVAGMTGDGVNDAPALKKADVGFAMGDGTEIAKEAGDIVILDNNFASIVKAILYGRTIFKSIRKFLIFQLSINLCAVGVSVIGPFIGIETPVTVIQMLWINMIMDTLAGLAYAGEPPLPEYMHEPPKRRNEKIINRYMYSQIICTGLYTTIMCLLFFKLPFMKVMFRGEEKYVLTAFFALFIFAGVFNSFNARTYRINLFSYILDNKGFLLIMGAVIAIQLLLIYYGGTLFRTAGLRLNELALIIVLSLTVVFFDLTRKMLLRIGNRKGFI